jgi:phosphopantothenate synthetase
MNYMRDPGAETAAQKRARRAPPSSLIDLTVGLFDIGKTRSDEFLDQVEKRFAERGLRTKRFAKPTNAKVAPDSVIHKVVADADVVLIALSD